VNGRLFPNGRPGAEPAIRYPKAKPYRGGLSKRQRKLHRRRLATRALSREISEIMLSMPPFFLNLYRGLPLDTPWGGQPEPP
jgi:hypothetical protein